MMDVFSSPAPVFQAAPEYVAFEDQNLKVVFNLKREFQNEHLVTALFSNKMPYMISQLNMQVAVQKYMTLKILPASSSELQPLAQQGATQQLRITNTMEGQKPLSLKVRMMYQSQNGQKVDQTKILSDLPTNY